MASGQLQFTFFAAPPPLLTPPIHTYQALLHFLQDSVLFVKAWIQKAHLGLPQAFNERDTQRARDILQVLSPAEGIQTVSECKPDLHTPITPPKKSVMTEKIRDKSGLEKL